MKNSFGLIHDSSELRKLIAENPDLPVVVLVGEEATSCGDYYYTYCSSVHCNIDYILDTHTPYDGETVFTDKDDFEEAVSDALWNKWTSKLSDSDYEAMVRAEASKYDQYWRKVIAVYVDN